MDLSRRDFVKTAVAGSLVVGAGGLAGCSSPASKGAAGAAGGSSGKPVRGGTIMAGLTGGASSDTVDGQKGVNNVDFARILSLYDPLANFDLDVRTQMALAESIEPNADATEWTIRLRPGITFHNGKPLTAADVIYSYQRVAANNLGGASSLAPCDIKHMKQLDNLTVRIPCKTPYATFVDAIVGYSYYLSILPAGFDPRHPVGTGPFKYKSFTPGTQSTFVANKNYWKNGLDGKPLPYADVVVIADYGDETSQVNALLSGQIHCANLLSADSIHVVQGSGANVLISSSGGMTPFTMRVDQAPFSDDNVRLGLRWVVDRKEMLSLVFAGHGTIGNDIFSPYDPQNDPSLFPQRSRDLDKARYYFRKAGVLGASVTMQTADIAQGTLKAAQVLKQQAAPLLNIALDQIDVTAFYGTEYLKWTFAQDYWYYSRYLPQVAQATLPISPFNETHFASPASNPQPPHVGARYISLYNQAVATVDAARRAEIVHELQSIDYNDGGYIIPYFPPVIDGYSKRLAGVLPSKAGLSLTNYGFQRFWLT